MLVKPTIAAARELGADTIALTGGVAANSRLRDRLAEAAAADGRRLVAPALKYCTDNAAMIALAGSYRLMRGERDALSIDAEADLASGFVSMTTARKSPRRNSVASSICTGARRRAAGEIARSKFSDQRGGRRSNRRGCAAIRIGRGGRDRPRPRHPDRENGRARPRRSLTLVELDPRLAVRLQERFTNIRVVNADFLAIDFAELVSDRWSK